MIKFFRKIRLRLLTESPPAERAGKVSKPASPAGRYLLYAIGEIFLVVIGILIALQINNWNESRKALNAELALYQTMLSNVNDEFVRMENHIANIRSYQDVTYHVYNETQEKAEYDSNVYYNTLQWIHPFNPIIHENYSVSIVDINNVEVRDWLNANIAAENKTIDAFIEWNEFKVEELRPFFNKYGIHNTEGAFNDQPYNFYSLLSVDLIEHSKLREQYGTVELDELLFNLRFKTSWLLSNLGSLKESNRGLAHVLEDELVQNNMLVRQHIAKYIEYTADAKKLYDSKDYLQSAMKYKEAFDQNEGKAYPSDRYNAACSFALAEDIESAFYHLFRLANSSDYKDYEHITTDSDLDILHQDKRWNELISIVKSNKN